MKVKHNKKGISLIEVVLVIAIFSIVIPVIYSIFFVGSTSYSTSKNIGFAQQDARLPINYLTGELRAAKNIYWIEPISEELYYELSLNAENKLVKITHQKDVADITQIIGSQIDTLEFKTVIKSIDESTDPDTIEYDYNNIELRVIAIENDYEREYLSNIRLENSSAFGVIYNKADSYLPDPYPEVFGKVFYTKHN